ncbi:HAD hydrolase family protein [Bacillus sp. JCM 19041]|uniref:HAD hydrolase family protein n=1 Tax=Bacillus sp. JCM 19041 TaxID=1460637 RepID=UPI0006D26AEE
MKAYKMVAVNIDGIMVNKENKMSKRTKAAVEYLTRKGVVVTLMTDQPFSHAKKAAKALKLDGFIVAHGGAFVSDTNKNEWFNRPLEMDNALDICHVLERFDCETRLLYGDHAISTRSQHKQTLLAKMSFGSPGEQMVYPTTYVNSLYEQVLKEGAGPLNMAISCEEQADLNHICSILEQEVPDIEITVKENGQCLIVGKGAGKARALQWLVRQRGMELEQVVAIGVHDEDVELLEMVGLGVAMGDANTALQESATWVTRTVDQEGFAYMVHEVFRKQLRIQV